jgi:hypothetical protein
MSRLLLTRRGSGAVAPPEPPDPPPSGDWLVEPPSGLTLLTSNPMDSLAHPGWGYDAYDSYSEIVAVGGGNNVARTYFPEWPNTPPLNPSWIGYSAFPSGRREVFVRFRMGLSSNWVEQDPGHKVMHLSFNTAENLVLGRGHPDTVWPEEYENNEGRWALGPTGWGATFTNPNRSNNVNHDAALWTNNIDEVAIHFRLMSGPSANDGLIRLWVRGVLTAEWLNLATPNTTLFDVHFAQVYGGGFNAITVTPTMYTDLDHVEIWSTP